MFMYMSQHVGEEGLITSHTCISKRLFHKGGKCMTHRLNYLPGGTRSFQKLHSCNTSNEKRNSILQEHRVYMFCAICKFAQFRNCTAQIRDCVIANQLPNCAAPFAHYWNCAGTHHQPVFFSLGWKAKHILEAKARITGEPKHTHFHPELEWWATVSILSGHTIFCPLSLRSVCLFWLG